MLYDATHIKLSHGKVMAYYIFKTNAFGKKDLHECISRPIQLHTCARQMKIYKTVNFGILNRHATHTHTPLSDVTQRIQGIKFFILLK